jgi:hypothetical protein
MEGPPKSTLEALVLPIVIAVVGVSSTYMITRTQIQSANRLATATLQSEERRAVAGRDSEERRATADQQIKILEMFSDQIKSKEASQRKMALQILTALEPEMAEKLAQAVAATDPDPEIKRAAVSVVRAVTPQGNSFVVIGSFHSLDEAKAALSVLQKRLGSFPFSPEVYLTDRQIYALTLGGYLSLSEANRRLTTAKDIAKDAYVKSSNLLGENLLLEH